MSTEISDAKRVALVSGAGSQSVGKHMGHRGPYGYDVIMGDIVADRLAAVERGIQADGGMLLQIPWAGLPEDSAHAVLSLVSPAAGLISGVALRVDGGDCLRAAL